jgi:hypothetical protein
VRERPKAEALGYPDASAKTKTTASAKAKAKAKTKAQATAKANRKATATADPCGMTNKRTGKGKGEIQGSFTTFRMTTRF